MNGRASDAAGKPPIFKVLRPASISRKPQYIEIKKATDKIWLLYVYNKDADSPTCYAFHSREDALAAYEEIWPEASRE